MNNATQKTIISPVASVSVESSLKSLDVFVGKQLHISKLDHSDVQVAKLQALGHFRDLLTALSRTYHYLDQTSMSKEELFSLVCHFSSSATLCQEQLLKVLFEQKNKNQIVNSKTTMQSRRLPHSLKLRYYACDLTISSFPKEMKEALFRTSGGEIATRNVVSLSDNRGALNERLVSVKSLLIRTYRVCNEKPTNQKNLNHCLKEAIEYGIEQLNLANMLLGHIQQTDRESEEMKEFVRNLESKLLSLLKNVKIAEKEMKEFPKTSFISEVEGALFDIKTHCVSDHKIALRIDNILFNFLPRLKTEWQIQEEIPHQQMRLHYATILMLNQYIAEELLYLLADLKEIKYDPQDIDHNLMKLLGLLNIDLIQLSKPVISFLERGKQTRDLLRYQQAQEQKQKQTKRKTKQKNPQIRSVSKPEELILKRMIELTSYTALHSYDEKGSTHHKGFDTPSNLIRFAKQDLLQDAQLLRDLILFLGKNIAEFSTQAKKDLKIDNAKEEKIAED